MVSDKTVMNMFNDIQMMTIVYTDSEMMTIMQPFETPLIKGFKHSLDYHKGGRVH